MAKSDKAGKFLKFKNRPLVRSGNTIYYGNPEDPYVAMLQIMSTEKLGELDTANKVTVQVIATDPTINPKDRILKKAEKNGLYSALQIAGIWLDRAIADK